MRRYYDANVSRFERRGRAVVSLLVVPRTITAADTQATRARVEALREEIVGGAKFEDVASRESQDQYTAAAGGSMGTRAKGTMDGIAGESGLRAPRRVRSRRHCWRPTAIT